MTLTIPDMTLEEATNLLNDDVLAHHGILGMKWGIRRFQKYPAGYSGDGKYVGPDGQPRQATKKELKRDRKYLELKSKIDRWTKDAIETGDKKTLKRLKKTMTPQEYQTNYDELVKQGVDRAIKEGDKKSLKKYKDDISKRQYQDSKVMADFNKAVSTLDTEKMNTLVSKIKNEDLKEAANRIATMTAFQNQKISALKVESEAAAKLSKVANTAGNVARIATSAKTVYDAISGAQKSREDRAYELRKRTKEIEKETRNEAIEKVIKSGNLDVVRANLSRMNNEQRNEAYKAAYYANKRAVDKAALSGEADKVKKWAELIGYSNAKGGGGGKKKKNK